MELEVIEELNEVSDKSGFAFYHQKYLTDDKCYKYIAIGLSALCKYDNKCSNKMIFWGEGEMV